MVLLDASASVLNAEGLDRVLDCAHQTEKRGYLSPKEEQEVQSLYLQFLRGRLELWTVVHDLQPYFHGDEKTEGSDRESLEVFLLGFSAAVVLYRASFELVSAGKEHSVLGGKWDEEALDLGIERKTFTAIYKSLSSLPLAWRFYQATQFFEKNREPLEALRAEGYGEVLDLMQGAIPFLESRKRKYLKRRVSYRLHSFLRRNQSGYRKTMFHLLRLSGSAISEIKQSWKKPKSGEPRRRATKKIISEALQKLQAGDVVVTRKDDAMTNLFLPGFWPHVALYLGDDDQRERLGVYLDQDFSDMPVFLEAQKDGVKLREPAETLDVDRLIILRPSLSEEKLSQALLESLTHRGKGYDFIFDFRDKNRLACTGLIYRTFHDIGHISFELVKHNGRLCLSAEDFIQQSLENNFFKVVSLFGMDGEHWINGDHAHELTMESCRSFS